MIHQDETSLTLTIMIPDCCSGDEIFGCIPRVNLTLIYVEQYLIFYSILS